MKRTRLALFVLVCTLGCMLFPVTATAAGGAFGQVVAVGDELLFIRPDKTLWSVSLDDVDPEQLTPDRMVDWFSEPVKLLDNIVEVYAADDTYYALSASGTLWAWGYNAYGQIGDGTMDSRDEPFQVMDGVAQIWPGYFDGSYYQHYGDFILALKTDGTLWGWGDNSQGQLGNEENEEEHEPIKIMDQVTTCNVGEESVCVIRNDKSLWVWAYNDPAYDVSASGRAPLKMTDDAVAASCHLGGGLVLKSDKTLWLWGTGSQDNINASKQLMGDVAAFAPGVVLKTDGTLWTWDTYEYYRIETGSNDIPTPTKALDNVSWIDPRGSAAILKDGSLWVTDYGGEFTEVMSDVHSTIYGMFIIDNSGVLWLREPYGSEAEIFPLIADVAKPSLSGSGGGDFPWMMVLIAAGVVVAGLVVLFLIKGKKKKASAPPTYGQPYDAPTYGQPYNGPQQGQPYNAPQQGQPYNVPQQGQPYNAPQQGQAYNVPQQGQPYNVPQQGQPYNAPQQGQPYNAPQQGQPPSLPAEDVRTCVGCGAELPLNARFCAKCGSPQ